MLKITMSVRDSGSEIEFETGQRVRIPEILYAWRLFDNNGREVHVSHTAGYFPGSRSKYATRPDLQTRRRLAAASYYDFRGKDPRTAMLEEILETGSGLGAVPDFPEVLFFAAGNYFSIPVKRNWSPAR